MIRSCLAGLAVVGAFGCSSSMAVHHDAAPHTSVSSFRTFRIHDPLVGQKDPELAKLLRHELESKGYEERQNGADVVVSYKLLVGTKKKDGADVSEVAMASGDADMLGVGQTNESRSKLLLLLIQDATSLETIWVGWSQGKASVGELSEMARESLGRLAERVPTRS